MKILYLEGISKGGNWGPLGWWWEYPGRYPGPPGWWRSFVMDAREGRAGTVEGYRCSQECWESLEQRQGAIDQVSLWFSPHMHGVSRLLYWPCTSSGKVMFPSSIYKSKLLHRITRVVSGVLQFGRRDTKYTSQIMREINKKTRPRSN